MEDKMKRKNSGVKLMLWGIMIILMAICRCIVAEADMVFYGWIGFGFIFNLIGFLKDN